MINNTTVKKKRFFCAFLVIALISSVFACWASAAGEEPGDSGATAEQIVVLAAEAEETAEADEEIQGETGMMEDGNEELVVVSDENGADEDVINIDELPLAMPEVVHSVEIVDAKYDAEAQKISVEIKNISDSDIEAQLVLTDADYAQTQVPCGLRLSQIAAGETFTMCVDYASEVEQPELGLIVQYAEILSSISKEQLENGSIGQFIGSNIVSYETMKIYETENIFEAMKSDDKVVADIPAEGEETVTAGEAVKNFINQTGFVQLFTTHWKCLIMIAIACVLLFLAIVKGFEPLLLLPIAFGMLLTNLPGAEMFHEELWAGGHVHWDLFGNSEAVTPGLLDYLYLGVKLGIYPCLIFFGVGAMTDFEPLIANPKSLLLGAAAQLGIFVTYVAAVLMGFNSMEAGSIGIIGGADGPTAIFVTSKLAPHLLGPIAVAAYSYMALVPVIQPPIMKLLTTKKERCIKMQALRKVSKTEKIIFPIVVTVFVALLVPSAAPLVGSLMLGNLFKESGVTERLSKTVQNELMNIVTIFLGVTVGATATADTFLSVQTIKIIIMGVIAFGLGTAGGVLLAKFMNLFLKNKINPLCGSAGVSAVPMAARVSQMVGQKEDPSNFLLMHAMGPNVAGVIGSAIAAGVMIALFG